MVFSLNILTQLEFQLVDFLRKRQISVMKRLLFSGLKYRKNILIL